MPASLMFGFVALFGAADRRLRPLDHRRGCRSSALALLGATDMISVYVRETLIQLWTPDEVRGRVNAVNMVFVGAPTSSASSAPARWRR